MFYELRNRKRRKSNDFFYFLWNHPLISAIIYFLGCLFQFEQSVTHWFTGFGQVAENCYAWNLFCSGNCSENFLFLYFQFSYGIKIFTFMCFLLNGTVQSFENNWVLYKVIMFIYWYYMLFSLSFELYITFVCYLLC